MTQLKDLQDIINLDIRSLQEVVDKTNPRAKHSYVKQIELEKKLVEQGKAPSLPAYLLYEYQFNGIPIKELSKKTGLCYGTLYRILKKIGIPIKTKSEARIGLYHSKETKRKISEVNRGENNPFYGKHLSKEHKQKISDALGGENNPNFGKTFSEKDRERLSKANMTSIAIKRNRRQGIKNAEALRRNSYNVEDRFFASSQQEGATALMLEKYIPNYQVQERKTFQVRDKGICNGGIDFLVNGEFLEWHPIVLYSKASPRGDIPQKMFPAYLEGLEFLPEDKRKEFREFCAKKLEEIYKEARHTAVDNSGYKGTRVNLVKDEKELYEFIARYNPNLPAFPIFASEFRKTIGYVKKFKVEKPTKEKAA